MKWKIALLSSVVLSLILVVLGGFLYWTVRDRVLSLKKVDLTSTARNIEQYYVSHLSEGSTQDTSVTQWLANTTRHDQEAVILNVNGTVMTRAGHLENTLTMAHFQPVTELVQRQLILSNGLPVVYTALPAKSEDTSQTIGYVVLISDISDVEKYLESLLMVLLIGTVGAVVLAGAGGYLIAHMALRPIHQLIHVVERIEATRLNERVPSPKARDEVARLTITFNHMLNRIERSFEQQKRFVADASHEIRTPLTAILGYANLLQRWGKSDPATVDKAVRVIHKGSTRLSHLADDLLLLAGLEASNDSTLERASVDTLVEEVCDELSILNSSVQVTRLLLANAEAQISTSHLRQIVTNVLSNALKYTSAGGHVLVKTEKTMNRVRIFITDTGQGIPAADLPHVFERFYRADKSRERKQGGTGLGLAIVHELVTQYGGNIKIESVEREGTTVTIELLLAK